MIHWKNVERSMNESDKTRWRREFCPRASHDEDGCMGYSAGEGCEPHPICMACDIHNARKWE